MYVFDEAPLLYLGKIDRFDLVPLHPAASDPSPESTYYPSVDGGPSCRIPGSAIYSWKIPHFEGGFLP